ncbi:MAG: RusA family crossover junction endodeoxyribonuclease [Patescibacteria group bacterium]|nr:RusA family crossover junction endodeoxyribonuclease [Patescibacteria group bacterium]
MDNPFFLGGRTIKLGVGLRKPATYIFRHDAQSKQRARSGDSGHYTPKKTREYEGAIAESTKMQHPMLSPFTGKIFTEIHFFTDAYHRDIDNMVKSIWDGMQTRRHNGNITHTGAFKNDNQIDGLFARRWFEPDESKHRTEVIIRPVTEKMIFAPGPGQHCPTCRCGIE